MIQILNKKDCISCFSCANKCPVEAISMLEDQEGFKYPAVDGQKCIECGLCNKVCPICNPPERKNLLNPNVYAAWSKSEQIRSDSTSGGIFSELAKEIYKQGGGVSGAVYASDWHVQHILSYEKKDLNQIRSSKYLQSDLNQVFLNIRDALDTGGGILFCGSPCQIAALYNFLEIDYENLYTIDFICKGMNSPEIFKKYISYLEEKYKSKATSVKFKHKKYGWHNFSTKVAFANGKNYYGWRFTDTFMIGYLKYNAFMRPSCYDCKFKNFPRMADITLADFWGIENIDERLDEDKGTSMVLINSSKGKELFHKISDNIRSEVVVSENVFQSNVCVNESSKMTETRNHVFRDMDTLTYKELSEKYFPEPKLFEKIILILKFNKKIQKIYRRLKKF